MTEPDLRLRAVVPAPPKVVYEALTDPAALRVWLAEHAEYDDAHPRVSRCRFARLHPTLDFGDTSGRVEERGFLTTRALLCLTGKKSHP